MEQAKEELLGIIDQITQQMTSIFAEQFQLLNESFQETFLELFGGGKARLELGMNVITEMYSLPAYDGIDPNPLMAPFFILFFGMMLADMARSMNITSENTTTM